MDRYYHTPRSDQFYQPGYSGSHYESRDLDSYSQSDCHYLSRYSDSYYQTSGHQSHFKPSAGYLGTPDHRDHCVSKQFHVRTSPDASNQSIKISHFHGNIKNIQQEAGCKTSSPYPSTQSERFHPYKLVGGPRRHKPAGPKASQHSYSLFGLHGSGVTKDDDEEKEDNDGDSNGDYDEEDKEVKNVGKKGTKNKKFFKKAAGVQHEIVNVDPVLSFEEYTSLWENEQNPRIKKLRLMACKACVSKEPRSIAKICNSRNAECNLKIAHRYDKELARRLGVPVVAHLLLDSVLAATGGSSTKVEAKRSAFDAALRALYMPYLRIYTAPDQHRELHASMVPFSEASQQQILKPKLPLAPKVIEHIKYRPMPARAENAVKKRRFRHRRVRSEKNNRCLIS